MIKNKITKIFDGVCVKRLSQVEIDSAISHQHEFNGVNQIKNIFGSHRLNNISTQFLFLTDDEEKNLFVDGSMTWYDAREQHPTRSEYRLYFSTNDVIDNSEAGDLLIIAKKANVEKVLVIVAKKESTIENQIKWLFGFGDKDLDKFYVADLDLEHIRTLDFSAEIILEKLGVELPERKSTDGLSAYIIEKFNADLPKTKIFSNEIYSYLKAEGLLDLVESPDNGITLLMRKEEICFKLLEKQLVQKKMDAGFSSVDDFISYSLSIQNRRKSRAGYAFENHLEELFIDNNIKFDRGKLTENNSKPDFIFPGITEYKDSKFITDKLTMLGVKTTCKDRWRQILPEADRIAKKHLATLEPSISINQTAEMERQNVSLVLPESIHDTYSNNQKRIIISIKEFVIYLKQKNP